MASSLAAMEYSELHVLYIWEHSPADHHRLSSELPEEVRRSIERKAEVAALEDVVKLTVSVLGEPLSAKPVALHGDVEDEVLEYLNAEAAGLLVTEGSPGSPLMNAVIGNRSLRLLNQAACSVLVSRPGDRWATLSDWPDVPEPDYRQTV